MHIAVINESTMVNNADITTMCAAIQTQLTSHVLPHWGMVNGVIRFYSDKVQVPSGAWVVNMLDDSTQAGALGYHSIDNDVVDAFIFAQPILSNGGVTMLFDPSNPQQYTVSATLSHEVCEMIGDVYANGFSVGPQIEQGNMYAQELCDPIENDSYGIQVNGGQIAVSNFILPTWFDPEATAQDAPFDYLHKLTAPFTMDDGGYMIVAAMSGEQQVMNRVFGSKVPQWRKDIIMSEFYRR